jgi:mannitol-1-/sugar-/sorbitol-6-/2-deoxyglucose-6-phosphatase
VHFAAVIQAVIFDMDGLLIDSEPYWRKSMIAVLSTVGLHLTEHQCAATTGLRFDQVLDYWYALQPWSGKSVASVHEEVLTQMEDAILNHAHIMPGALDAIAWCRAHNLRIAIASSSAKRLIEACVCRLDAVGVFDKLVSAEYETHGKPHPAVFLQAANLLGVAPEKCVVLEDSYNGMIAAKAAQMTCVMIPDAADYDNPKWVIADRKLKSLHEIAIIATL